MINQTFSSSNQNESLESRFSSLSTAFLTCCLSILASMKLGWGLAGFCLLAAGCGGTGASNMNLPASNGPMGASRFSNDGKPVQLGLTPVRSTEALPNDSDDPAIWVHPTDGTKSLILGTDKHEATGGLFVFDLQGKIVQKITPLDRPNNVDVIQGVKLGDKTMDLAVVTERVQEQLKFYSIDENGSLSDITGKTKILPEAQGDEKLPMGAAFWKLPDESVQVFVSPKTGPKLGYIAQYKLSLSSEGKVDITLVRRLGSFSGPDKEGSGEIEALVVDQGAGQLYFSDELAAIKRMPADPANKAGEYSFARGEYKGDREGLAVVKFDKTKWLLSSDQIEGGTRLFVWDIGGRLPRKAAIIPTPCDSTDGLDATTTPLGPDFPEGMLVMMNSKDKNFMLFDLREVKRAVAAGRR